MKKISVVIESIAQTEKVGLLLGRESFESGVICLEGDLGAGKTTLTQFIARGLEIDKNEYVTSPSFAILHEYKGRIPLYHMDLYRLGSGDELIELGFEDFFYGDGLCVIEWSSRGEDLIPEDNLKITIKTIDENKRELILECAMESRWHNVVHLVAGIFDKAD